MDISIIRTKLLEEIEKFPKDRLGELYDFIHFFRLGLQTKTPDAGKIIQFAGSWKDMQEEDFSEFMGDIAARRKAAFASRRDRGTGID